MGAATSARLTKRKIPNHKRDAPNCPMLSGRSPLSQGECLTPLSASLPSNLGYFGCFSPNMAKTERDLTDPLLAIATLKCRWSQQVPRKGPDASLFSTGTGGTYKISHCSQ